MCSRQICSNCVIISCSSSSSSSPLLSLVQVPAKLAINLSIHTQHTYDNGVDRTGDRVLERYSFLHEEREEEKFLTPRLCSIWSTVWEQKKNTSAQKHIYHKHMTCNRGTYPALASSHPVQCHLFRRRSQTCSTGGGTKRFTEAVEWGRGVMSVVGGGGEKIHTPSLSQGGYPDGLGQGAGTGSQKR